MSKFSRFIFRRTAFLTQARFNRRIALTFQTSRSYSSAEQWTAIQFFKALRRKHRDPSELSADIYQRWKRFSAWENDGENNVVNEALILSQLVHLVVHHGFVLYAAKQISLSCVFNLKVNGHPLDKKGMLKQQLLSPAPTYVSNFVFDPAYRFARKFWPTRCVVPYEASGPADWLKKNPPGKVIRFAEAVISFFECNGLSTKKAIQIAQGTIMDLQSKNISIARRKNLPKPLSEIIRHQFNDQVVSPMSRDASHFNW